MALIESPYITDPNDPRLKDQLSLPPLPLGLERQAGMRLISSPDSAPKPSLMSAPEGFHEQGPTSGKFDSPVRSALAPDQGHEETADSILPKTLQEPTEFLAPKSKLNVNALGKEAYENERPQISAKPGTADFFQQNLGQQQFDSQHPLGSPVSKQPGILGKIEHGLGRFANIAADIAAPEVSAFIPGSDVNKGILQHDSFDRFERAKTEEDRTNLEQQRVNADKDKFGVAGHLVDPVSGDVSAIIHNPDGTVKMQKIGNVGVKPADDEKDWTPITLAVPSDPNDPNSTKVNTQFMVNKAALNSKEPRLPGESDHDFYQRIGALREFGDAKQTNGQQPKEQYAGVSGKALLPAIREKEPNLAADIQGAIDGTLDPTKLASMRNDERERFYGLTKRVDGTFDSTNYPARAAARKNFAPGGSGANSLLAINTGIQHLSESNNAIGELAKNEIAGGKYPLINKGQSLFQEYVSGGADFDRFDTDKTALSSELGNIFKATGATDQEIDLWTKRLQASKSIGQLYTNVGAMAKLIAGRSNSLKDQYDVAFPKTGSSKPAFLIPQANEALNSMITSAKEQQKTASKDDKQAYSSVIDGLSRLQRSLGGSNDEPTSKQESKPAAKPTADQPVRKYNVATGKLE